MGGPGSYLTARLKSFGYALAGLGFMLRTQGNAQIHLGVTILVAVLGIWLRIDSSDWLWLIAAMALVWITEGLNTAIECLCDVVSPDHHDGVGTAKDVAAGSVLVAAVAAAMIGVTVFWPYLAGT